MKEQEKQTVVSVEQLLTALYKYVRSLEMRLEAHEGVQKDEEVEQEAAKQDEEKPKE